LGFPLQFFPGNFLSFLLKIQQNINRFGEGATESKDEFLGTKYRKFNKFEKVQPTPKQYILIFTLPSLF
jgi:hypothetical protein